MNGARVTHENNHDLEMGGGSYVSTKQSSHRQNDYAVGKHILLA